MIVVTDPRCALHAPEHEILSGGLVPSVLASTLSRRISLMLVRFIRYLESPDRLKRIEDWLRSYDAPQEYREAFGEAFVFEKAFDLGLEPILAVHSKEYVDYLKTAYGAWCRDGGSKVSARSVPRNTFSDAHEPQSGVVPETFPTPNMGIKAMPPTAELSPIAKAGQSVHNNDGRICS